MAEGIFQNLAKQPQYKGKIGKIDSCGTGAYHTGQKPDFRTLSTLEDNGITDYHHAARRVSTSDFETFDYIFAMDHENLSDLQRMPKSHAGTRAKVMLFGEYSGTGKTESVHDPYYGGADGFVDAFEKCKRFSENFLKDVVCG